MKRKIRSSVFETNSSSVHSLTMLMKTDYERWKQDDLYLYTGNGEQWAINRPVTNALYTESDVVEFVRRHEYYIDGDELDEELIEDLNFILFRKSCNEWLDSFYEEFTTPSGETVVAFGEYGRL